MNWCVIFWILLFLDALSIDLLPPGLFVAAQQNQGAFFNRHFASVSVNR